MMNHDRKRPVSLEDLLQLKRAERPSVEFWAQYERELRAKQLAALVEKRPWWQTLSLARVFVGFRRYQLPLGAAAVLAVTVLSMRDYAPRSKVGIPEPVPAHAAVNSSEVQTVQPTHAVVAVTMEAPSAPLAVNVTAVAENPVPMSAVAATPVDSVAVAESSSSPAASLLTAAPLMAEESNSPAPVSLLVADTFGSPQGADTLLSRHLLNPAQGFESRAMPAKPKPVEPLSQIKISTTSRRSNLIASATLASTTSPVLASERSARGLSDERLYDNVSRINARGAGVLVKF